MAANDPWSKMHSSIFNHEKTRRVAKALGEPMYNAAGAFLALVAYANLNVPDGELVGWDAKDVEKAIGWEGEKNAFFNAILDAGFLDKTSAGYRIHNRMLYAQAFVNAIKQREKRKKSKNKKTQKRTSTRTGTRKGTGTGSRPTHVPVASLSTASESGAVETSNQPQATAARAALTPVDECRLATDKATYEALQRDADQADASFAQTQKSQHTPKKSAAPQGDPAQLPAAASSNLPACVPPDRSPLSSFLSHLPTRAPEAAAPIAEIVEKTDSALTQAKIEDAMRWRWGKPVKFSITARRAMRALLAEGHVVTLAMLDEAYADAAGWHEEKRTAVTATMVVNMLRDQANAALDAAERASNTAGAAHGATLRERGPAPRLTRREEAERRMYQEVELRQMEDEAMERKIAAQLAAQKGKV